MKKFLIFLLILIIIIIIILFWPEPEKGEIIETIPESDCEITEMTYYFSDLCGVCQRVNQDNSIDILKNLGVRIEMIDVKKGVIRHQFEGIPTFIINDVVYSGYMTFEQLKELLGCN